MRMIVFASSVKARRSRMLLSTHFTLIPSLIFVAFSLVAVKAFPLDEEGTRQTLVDLNKNDTEAIVNSTASHYSEYLDSSGNVDTTGGLGLTEYPVFASATESNDGTQTESPPESEVDTEESVTEGFMYIQDQEEDDTTVSSAVVRSTEPMPSQSSREQEEVLRELKKLWDLKEELSIDIGLRSSLSSIVHLAYAKMYSESDETLLKLTKLLKELQQRLVGSEANGDEKFSITAAVTPQFSLSSQEKLLASLPIPSSYNLGDVEEGAVTDTAESNYFTTPTSLMTATTVYPDMNARGYHDDHHRMKRSYYEGLEKDIESIFLGNVNSQENSVIPDVQNYEKEAMTAQQQGHNNNQDDTHQNQRNVNSDNKTDHDTVILRNNNQKSHNNNGYSVIVEDDNVVITTKSPFLVDELAAHLLNSNNNSSYGNHDGGEDNDTIFYGEDTTTVSSVSGNGSDLSENKLMQKTGEYLASASTSTSNTILSVSSTTTSLPVTSRQSPQNSLSSIKKIVHINDRRKPMPSFYLTPERIQELKNRMTSTSPLPPLNLSPISIPIQDEVENEVNLLQQQGQVDNYDVHISDIDQKLHYQPASFYPPLVSTTLTPFFNENEIKKTTMIPFLSTVLPSRPPQTFSTEMPYSPDEVAFALFQLLRPEPPQSPHFGNDIEMVTIRPKPPSSVLYQMGSQNSAMNFSISKPPSKTTTVTSTGSTSTATSPTTTPPTTTTAPTTTTKRITTLSPNLLTILKMKDFLKQNNSILLDLPSEFSHLGMSLTTTKPKISYAPSSTERQDTYQNNNDVYDYNDVTDPPPPKPLGDTLINGLVLTLQQILEAMARLSLGAKVILLFSFTISLLSIGIGLYDFGPPLAGLGFLGIVIPMAFFLLLETTSAANSNPNPAGRKNLNRKQELLLKQMQSEEISHILESILDAVAKYGKG